MQKGICKLCLQYKELCKESHIIPRFLYKFLTDEKHSIIYLDINKAQRRFNSEYEGNILCQNCDNNIIGRLDDYAAKLLQGGFKGEINFQIVKINEKEYLTLENDLNYDYNRFKLFLISILWRSSISSRQFFIRVKLSSIIENDLRQMIIQNNPGKPEEYACFMLLPPLTVSPDGVRGFNTTLMPTMSPYTETNKNLEMCKFIIQGTHYTFFLTKNLGTNIEPWVTKNKLVLGFAALEEQTKILQYLLDTIEGHSDDKTSI